MDIFTYILQVTYFATAPPILLQITQNEELLKKYDLSSLTKISCGAAPLPENVNVDTAMKTQTMITQGNSFDGLVLLLHTTFTNLRGYPVE